MAALGKQQQKEHSWEEHDDSKIKADELWQKTELR
jgi:hypothetical protein